MGTRTALSFVFVAVVALVSVGNVSAQANPTADGVISPGEYSNESVDGPVHLYSRFDSTRIYLAVEGRTSGWVAIGLSSRRMNGAQIFMGFVSNGRPEFSTQAGARHSHSESSDFAAVEHGIGESGGTTTMELVLDRASFLGPAQSTLDVIFALGSSDSFRQYHSFRSSTSLRID